MMARSPPRWRNRPASRAGPRRPLPAPRRRRPRTRRARRRPKAQGHVASATRPCLRRRVESLPRPPAPVGQTAHRATSLPARAARPGRLPPIGGTGRSGRHPPLGKAPRAARRRCPGRHANLRSHPRRPANGPAARVCDKRRCCSATCRPNGRHRSSVPPTSAPILKQEGIIAARQPQSRLRPCRLRTAPTQAPAAATTPAARAMALAPRFAAGKLMLRMWRCSRQVRPHWDISSGWIVVRPLSKTSPQVAQRPASGTA